MDVMVLDDTVIVNMLKPIGCQTFHDYSDNIFKPYVSRQLKNV